MLPDLLDENLVIVICGSAAGDASARRQQYYAGPGNVFWVTLYDIGLTPVKLTPAEYPNLLTYGIGLTDIVKRKSGPDSRLSTTDFDGSALREKMLRYRPGTLCFNGKRAAQEFLGHKKIDYGLQSELIGVTRLFVAPSTSAAARRYWNVAVWRELADLCRLIA